MIDRDRRNRLAECIRHLAAGVLTNLEFEDRAESHSADSAIQAVFWGGPWLLYDDYRRRAALSGGDLERSRAQIRLEHHSWRGGEGA